MMKRQRLSRLAGLGGVLGVAMLIAQPAQALSFRVGDLQGAFDTDVTYGIQARTESPERENRGAYGNRALFEDKWDIFSNQIRASHTFSLDGDGWGTLVRGNYFYDFEMANQPLPSAAKNRLKQHGDITDAYFYATFGDNSQYHLRIGKQVISWGEGAFFQGSLADINTVDLNKLRQPGRELKDAFIGTPAIFGSWAINDIFTLESFYLLGFDELKLDPMGSFFTTLDAVSDGGGFPNDTLVAGPPFAVGRPTCVAPDGVSCAIVAGLPTAGGGLGGLIARAPDAIPSYGGQFGVALRWFVPGLLNGSEIGFYFENLHSHLPYLISGGFGPGAGTFFLAYPKNIHRYGISFNTNVAGLAVSGEYAYRPNEVTQTIGPGVSLGFKRLGRHQWDILFDKNWGVLHAMKADAARTFVEFAGGWLNDKPSAAVLFSSKGTVAPTGAPTPATVHGNISTSFYSVQIRHSQTYQAALFNLIAVVPNIALRWDIKGTSQEIVPLFHEDNKSVSIGTDFTYGQGTWKGSVSYTSFFGGQRDRNSAGSRINGRTDRDFVSVSLSYSF